MSTKKPRAAEAFDLLKAGKEKEALAILERIVREDNADAAVLETLGDVREKLGDKEGALDAYAGAVTHLRARTELKRALGVLELMVLVDEHALWPRREGAEIRFELDDFAGCWREVVAFSDAAARARQIDLALDLCREMADVLPDSAPALIVAKKLEGQAAIASALCVDLGNALRRREKHDEALALYARAIELLPSSTAAHRARAGALVSTGRFAEARVVVDRLLTLDPHDLVALSLLERIAQALGDDATVRTARERFEREAAAREGPPGEMWSEDTAELRGDTEDDPTDLER